MYKRIFLDTNVVLDLVLGRSEFLSEAKHIFELNSNGDIDLFVSSLTLANVSYIAKRNGKDPFFVIRKLLDWLSVIDLQTRFFHQTLTSAFKDFEDGLQYFCASSIQGLDIIITRNKKDFQSSIIPVLTPAEFVKTLSN